jgi:hypothetical protein
MRKFGVEIELIAPVGMSRADMAARLTEAGVPAFDGGNYHSHSRVSDKWKFEGDGSLPRDTGMELVSPPLEQSELSTIERVCETLEQSGCSVNKQCGLHVHVSASDLQVNALKRLAALYMEHEKVIDAMLPASRRASNSTYCRTLTAADMTALSRATSAQDIAQAISPDVSTIGYGRLRGQTRRTATKNMKLNFQPFWRLGTVEFRHHSGTIDASKIVKWIQLCIRMVELAVKEADEPLTVSVSTRPDTRKMQLFYDLMARPEGGTAEEWRVALGRDSRPSGIEKMLNAAGVAFYKQGRRNGQACYFLRTAAASPVAQPTLDSLAARLELPEDEKDFWTQRTTTLGAITRS